jgi:hypothetical protein
MNADTVRALLRRAVEAEGGMRAWARKHKVSAMYVSYVLSGAKEPGEAILKPLGLERVVTYRQVR